MIHDEMINISSYYMMSAATKKSSSTSHFIRNGCKWTHKEDRVLLDRFNEYKDYKKICTELHRSVDALQARMVKIFIYPKIKFIFYEHEKFNEEYFNRFYLGVVEDYSKEYNISKDNFMLYLKYTDKNLNPKNLLKHTVHNKVSKILNNIVSESNPKTILKNNANNTDKVNNKKIQKVIYDNSDSYDSHDSYDSDDESYDSHDSDDESYDSHDSYDESYDSHDSHESDNESDIDTSYLDDIQRKLKRMKSLSEINRKLNLINSKLDKLLKRK
jgi:hypothetical protein